MAALHRIRNLYAAGAGTLCDAPAVSGPGGREGTDQTGEGQEQNIKLKQLPDLYRVDASETLVEKLKQTYGEANVILLDKKGNGEKS